ncbi:MAG: hypothetical protein ACOYNL_04140 [Rickettsiales bacterium]
MHKLPTVRPADADMDAILRDKQAEIEALIQAMANNEADCDVKLAELLEGESEVVRISIVKAIRDQLRERAAEKELELDQHLAAAKRMEVTRQRNMFMQWLTWIMSEETLRKLRLAFLANSGMEKSVRNIGHELANFGMQASLADKRELGGMAANQTPNVAQDKDKGKGAYKGRS